ncbi:hypothetical protein [Bifidobacterium leontopitheci]|uniref:Uncharacterized protein n=1 Tax=Bifidobacterium leontopitheci TaxID=2650774 RepID=A0A6I1GH07_9BIFI|nr:hypothetical protein [Bifidobacterium leontopitheci]KAB7790895.1 hypothetical protein F7D09_0630 [Bifidobacterium leontopitheci]
MTTTNDDRFMLDSTAAPCVPRWAGDVDIRTMGGERRTSFVGGCNAVDDPGYSLGVLLTVSVTDSGDGVRTADGSIIVADGEGGHDVPLQLADRAAACLALMAAAYRQDMPEPDARQIEAMARAIRDAAEHVTGERRTDSQRQDATTGSAMADTADTEQKI